MLAARDDRRDVGPVLEQLAVVDGVGEHRARVRAEAGEQRQLLAAHEHVHRVDLDHVDAVEHLAQVAAVDASGSVAGRRTPGRRGRCGGPGPRSSERRVRASGRCAIVRSARRGVRRSARRRRGRRRCRRRTPPSTAPASHAWRCRSRRRAGRGRTGRATPGRHRRSRPADATGWTHSERAPAGDAERQRGRIEAGLQPGPQAVTALVHGGKGVGADELGGDVRCRQPS